MTRTRPRTMWALVLPQGMISYLIRPTRKGVMNSLHDWSEHQRYGYRIEKVTIVPGWKTTPKKRGR